MKGLVNQINAILEGNVELNELSETEIASSINEGYHGGDGRFYGGHKGANLWSRSGVRFRVVVNKEGRHWKVPVRGRLRSEMSKAERRKAEQRDARRKKLGKDTGLPEGYNSGSDELDAMMNPVEREDLFRSPLDGMDEASDVKVDRQSIEFASGQEPDKDWIDKDFAILMSFEFDLSGKTLARFLWKQQRVLKAALEKMKPGDALRDLNSRTGINIMKSVFREVRKGIQAELIDVASSIGWDGAKVTDIELSDDDSHWEAKIDANKESIHFRVEVDVLGSWVGKRSEDVVEEVLAMLSSQDK